APAVAPAQRSAGAGRDVGPGPRRRERRRPGRAGRARPTRAGDARGGPFVRGRRRARRPRDGSGRPRTRHGRTPRRRQGGARRAQPRQEPAARLGERRDGRPPHLTCKDLVGKRVDAAPRGEGSTLPLPSAGGQTMRKLLAVPVFAVLLSLAPGAQAATHPRLTLSLSSYKVLYGHQLTLSGRLVPGAAGRMVTIESWRYGSSRPTVVATVTTRSGGHWSAGVRPSIQTTYRARVGTTASVRHTVGVRPLVVLHELGNGHLWTRVTAGRSFAGRFVQLQREIGGSWQTVARKQL